MIRRRLPLPTLLFLLTLAAAFAAAPADAFGSSAACNPRTHGAKGDGVTKDTAAIQAAIDACEQRGGGTVRLVAGTYLSAPIVLKSNITLQLDKGATLLGSADHADYPPLTMFHLPDLQPLVMATNATNLAITGEGVIDGAGESWWKEARSIKDHGILGTGHPRPKMIIFDHCKHVRVEGVTIQNSPMWQLVPYYSDDMVIRNIRVLSPVNAPNTDAIDPFSSSHVVIDHVYADVGDDNVTDCTFLHGHGLSIGSEISGGVQNIRAERIHFEGTDNGIRIKSNRDRGNDIGHFFFRDIEMKDVKNALVISEYYPKILPPATETAQPVTRLTPHFHDITLENVTATGSISAGAIVGLPEAPITGVVLRNVNLSAKTGLTIAYAEVTGEHVTVQAETGEAITKQAGAKVTLR